MSDEAFFVITPEHADTGEFRAEEVGWYAIRYDTGAVLVMADRAGAERIWTTVAGRLGYTHN
jgi:hypothetical protein